MDVLQTKVLDANAAFLGVPIEHLMEQAGKSVAKEAQRLPYKKWLVICGPGNNGGDGYVAARYIKKCTVIVVARPKTMLAVKNFRRAKSTGVPMLPYEKRSFPDILSHHDAVIDAMLGIGSHGDLNPPYSEIVRALNDAPVFTLAVDVPTGLGGTVSCKADTTVTFHTKKEGVSEERCGTIIVADIGIPKEAELYVGTGDLLRYPRPRKKSHKGENGVSTIVGGGPYTGAPALSGLAALRTGCDLSYVCCPFPVWQVITSFSPALIVRRMEGLLFSVENLDEIREVLDRADALLIGPGLGADATTVQACRTLIEMYVSKKNLVVDADAIESIRDMKDGAGRIVVTPHAGEFKKLTGIQPPEDTEERKKVVAEQARQRHLTILLKGPVDIISDGTTTVMNRIHTEAMTKGGTGDVLAGICVALLAKKVKPLHAASMAAFINGMAGTMAFDEKSYGLLASDIIEKIPEVLKKYLPRGY